MGAMPEASISPNTASARFMSPFCTHPFASVVYVTAFGVRPAVAAVVAAVAVAVLLLLLLLIMVAVVIVVMVVVVVV